MVLTVEGNPPADIITHGGYGNAKRVGHDISPNWNSMISLVDIGAGLWPYAHNSQNPTYGGWWNDLDMIEIGNGGSYDAAAAQPKPKPKLASHLDDLSTLLTTMYPWGIELGTPAAGNWSGSGNWSMEQQADGTGTGTVRANGLCLTAASGAVTLSDCLDSTKETQQFTLEANGNLHLTSKPNACLGRLGNQPHPSLNMHLGLAL